MLKKLRQWFFDNSRTVRNEQLPFGVRLSRNLSTRLAAVIAINKIHEEEITAISTGIAEIEKGTLILLYPAKFRLVLYSLWNRQLDFRDLLENQAEEEKKARENELRMSESGVLFSKAAVMNVEWKFVLSDHFTKCIKKIDKKLQGRVLEAITNIGERPLTASGDTVKPLSGDMKGLWRYRVGDYRLVYDPDSDGLLITLLSFEPRGDVY